MELSLSSTQSTSNVVTNASLVILNVTAHISISTTLPSNKTEHPSQNGLSNFDILIIIICIPAFIAAILGNVLVILVRLKKLRQAGLSAYKLMICHLSIADLIYSTAIPIDIYLKINKRTCLQTTGACKLIKTSQSASLTASICIMTVMAFERFQGVSDPLGHYWSNKKVTITALVIWLYGYVNFIPYAMALDVLKGQCRDFEYPSKLFAKWYTLYQFLSTWLLPLLLIIGFHIGMITKVVKHRKSIRKSTHRGALAKPLTKKADDKTHVRNRKMIQILVVIVTLFAMLTLPIHIWYLWYEYSDRSETADYDLKVVEIFATFVYLHTAVNPIIYSVMDRRFRDEIKQFFGFTSQQDENIPMRTMNGETLGSA